VISTFINLQVPSQSEINFAIGGLIILLVLSQLLDFDGSKLKFITRYILVFTVPMLALFVIITLIRIIRVL
jgi:hypothetical protein